MCVTPWKKKPLSKGQNKHKRGWQDECVSSRLGLFGGYNSNVSLADYHTGNSQVRLVERNNRFHNGNIDCIGNALSASSSSSLFRDKLHVSLLNGTNPSIICFNFILLCCLFLKKNYDAFYNVYSFIFCLLAFEIILIIKKCQYIKIHYILIFLIIILIMVNLF